LRQVEGKLDARGAANQQQRHERPDDLRDHQIGRRREQQADHQRQLADGERVRAAAEVRVDDEHLGRAEGDRQGPPRHVHAAGVCGQVANIRQVERHGRRRDERREQPDAERSPAHQPQLRPDQLRPDQLLPDQLRPDQLRPVQPFSPSPTDGAVPAASSRR
jgi:hypothetical protein